MKYNLYLVGSCVSKIEAEYPWLHKEGFQENLDKYLKNVQCIYILLILIPCPVTVFEAMSSGLI